MPDPESVGNQSREECEEGIDRMYEPIAEEIARRNCDAPFHDTREGLCSYCETLAREIRAAVDAETEYWEKNIKDDARRAGIDSRGCVGMAVCHLMVEEIERQRIVPDFWSVVCPDCQSEIGMPCTSKAAGKPRTPDVVHIERAIVATATHNRNCDELSYADLRASGGLPEAQEAAAIRSKPKENQP